MRTFSAIAMVLLTTAIVQRDVAAQGLGVAGSLQQLSNGSAILRVQQVVPGSLASRLGVVAGDSIVSINGFPPGDRVANDRAIAAGRGLPTIVVDRRGARVTLGNRGGTVPILPGGGHIPGGGQIPGGGLTRPSVELIPHRKGPDLQIDLETTTGLSGSRVSVIGVQRNGLGHLLGLRIGDVIDSVNLRPVSTVDEAARLYVVTDRRQIIIGASRNGSRGKIVIDEPTLRRLLGNRPGTGRPGTKPKPPAKLKTPLKLITFRRPDGKVTVSGGTSGLGSKLGLAVRGTVILSVNGTAIRTPADMKRIDDAILNGEYTQLSIRVIRPSGKEETVRYP